MKIFKILFLFICVSSFAQSKVGTIDVDFVISKLPELTTIQKQMETYGKELDSELQIKLKKYDTLTKGYQVEEATYTVAVKQEKQQAIIALEEDINKFQQNGTKLVNLKRDELLRPSYQKIGVALEKVAKTEGYTQVLQIDNTIVYLDPKYDLTELVLTELGITLDKK